MQDSWLSSKADEIQSFADRKDMKKFLDALKTVYGPQNSGTTPLLSVVFLIGHHLSMMTLSTDYQRWNAI